MLGSPGLGRHPAALDEARKLIDDLELEAALKALDAADKTEGNDRATVLEILTLQGIAFGTLGKDAKTRDSFRKLLMLAPRATLPVRPAAPRAHPLLRGAATGRAPTVRIAVTGGADLEGGFVQAVKVLVDKDVLRLARTVRFHLELDGEEVDPRRAARRRQGRGAGAPAGRQLVGGGAQRSQGRALRPRQRGPARQDGELRPRVAAVEAPLRVETPGPVSGGWRRPTGFVLVGAGAVAAGIGVFLGVQSGGRARPPHQRRA